MIQKLASPTLFMAAALLLPVGEGAAEVPVLDPVPFVLFVWLPTWLTLFTPLPSSLVMT